MDDDGSWTGYLVDKGNKNPKETIRRLKLFFPDPKLQLARLTVERAAALYRHVDDEGTVTGFVVGKSVDYHRNVLAEAKTFLRWCGSRNGLRRTHSRAYLALADAIPASRNSPVMKLSGGYSPRCGWHGVATMARSERFWRSPWRFASLTCLTRSCAT
jgi:hypothetical protein